MILPKSPEGFETDTWWGRWALDCRHAGFCTVAIQKRLVGSAAEGRPFPQGSSTENGSCRTGIVLFWSRLRGDSWPRGGIRRQGGSIWMMLQLAEASWSIILVHKCTHSETCTCIFTFSHTYKNIYCRNTTHQGLADMSLWRMIPITLELSC